MDSLSGKPLADTGEAKAEPGEAAGTSSPEPSAPTIEEALSELYASSEPFPEGRSAGADAGASAAGEAPNGDRNRQSTAADAGASASAAGDSRVSDIAAGSGLAAGTAAGGDSAPGAASDFVIASDATSDGGSEPAAAVSDPASDAAVNSAAVENRADTAADVGAPFGSGEVGLGVDIVEVARMEQVLKRSPTFATRVFSDAERAYCDGTAVPAVHYALRFAAKEAVVKALGCGFARGIGVRDIEVKRAASGKPSVRLSGRAQEIAAEQGVRDMPLSLSYTHTEAVAIAIAVTADSLRATKERVDPKEELARQFKETRGILDDL